MPVWRALLTASLAVSPAVTAASALLTMGRHDATPAAPSNATPTAAPSNFIAYKPDTFYEKDFASDSDNPLEELSYSETYPKSLSVNGSAGASDEQAAKIAPAAASEMPKEMPKEMSKTNNTNTSAVQITDPNSSETVTYNTPASEALTATSPEPTTAAKTVDATSAKDATSESKGTSAKQSSCSTRKDVRAAAWFAETAPEGSPCVFGVDARDEGSHCILDNGKYGSHGWCYTVEEATEWGSCDKGCPLHGSTKAVAAKIDVLADQVGQLKKRVLAVKGAKVAEQGINAVVAPGSLLQHHKTLSHRGQNSQSGPIDWLSSWFKSSDLNESAQIAVSTAKDSANSTKKNQVVAIPLSSQLLQQSPASAPPPPPIANSSAMELDSDSARQDAGAVVAVKLQSQLLQKQSAPKSKETGSVVAVKLQSQLLQKKSTPKSKGRKTSLMHKHKRAKAAQLGHANKTKKGVVEVKLQSQL